MSDSTVRGSRSARALRLITAGACPFLGTVSLASYADEEKLKVPEPVERCVSCHPDTRMELGRSRNASERAVVLGFLETLAPAAAPSLAKGADEAPGADTSAHVATGSAGSP